MAKFNWKIISTCKYTLKYTLKLTLGAKEKKRNHKSLATLTSKQITETIARLWQEV